MLKSYDMYLTIVVSLKKLVSSSVSTVNKLVVGF
jgi:hypothetical protein